MIRFFRQVRLNLLQQNRVTKYFQYAFGEIFLVVIGILIALSINTWNEGRKDSLRFESELKELRSELLEFDERLAIRSESLHSIDAYGKYLQDFITGKLGEIDTVQLRKAIYYNGYLLVVEKSSSAYQNLINSGDIKFIQNAELKSALGVFYNKDGWRSSFHDNVILKSYEEYLRKIHSYAFPEAMRTFYEAEMPNVINDIALSGKAIEKLDEPFGTMVNWDKMKTDAEFSELLDNVLTNRYLQIGQYEIENRNDIKRIVSLIDLELNKYD